MRSTIWCAGSATAHGRKVIRVRRSARCGTHDSPIRCATGDPGGLSVGRRGFPEVGFDPGRPELHRFRHMLDGDVVVRRRGRDRARDPAHPVESARAQPEPFGGRSQQGAGWPRPEGSGALMSARGERAVRRRSCSGVALFLALPCSRQRGARISCDDSARPLVPSMLGRQRRDFDREIQPIAQRSRQRDRRSARSAAACSGTRAAGRRQTRTGTGSSRRPA